MPTQVYKVIWEMHPSVEWWSLRIIPPSLVWNVCKNCQIMFAGVFWHHQASSLSSYPPIWQYFKFCKIFRHFVSDLFLPVFKFRYFAVCFHDNVSLDIEHYKDPKTLHIWASDWSFHPEITFSQFCATFRVKFYQKNVMLMFLTKNLKKKGRYHLLNTQYFVKHITSWWMNCAILFTNMLQN